jgi:hypothetical protein
MWQPFADPLGLGSARRLGSKSDVNPGGFVGYAEGELLDLMRGAEEKRGMICFGEKSYRVQRRPWNLGRVGGEAERRAGLGLALLHETQQAGPS